jgi:hypothetical protein
LIIEDLYLLFRISFCITTGEKSYVISPFNCTIESWKVISSLTGSCVIDIWKSTGIPNVSDSITGVVKPNLSSQQINTSVDLTGWSTSISIGDIILFNIESTDLNKIYLYIEIEKI